MLVLLCANGDPGSPNYQQADNYSSKVCGNAKALNFHAARRSRLLPARVLTYQTSPINLPSAHFSTYFLTDCTSIPICSGYAGTPNNSGHSAMHLLFST